MHYARSIKGPVRFQLEAALPSLLQDGETALLVITCQSVPTETHRLLVTDRRLVSLTKQHSAVSEVLRSSVQAWSTSFWGNARLFTADSEIKLGTVMPEDYKLLEEVLSPVLPNSSVVAAMDPLDAAAEQAPKSPTVAPSSLPNALAPSVSPPDSVAEALVNLAQLHQQGLLSEAQFEAAKVATIGLPTPPKTDLQPLSPPVLAPPSLPRGKRKKVREMQRTCSIDGTIWFVPLVIASTKKPSRFERTGLKMQEFAATGLLTGGSSASVALSRIDAEWARAVQASQCPTCGSQAYVEVLVKH